MEIRREKYHIISTGKPEGLPVEGEKVNLQVRKKSIREISKVIVNEDKAKLEEEIKPQNAEIEISYVLPEGIYVFIQGLASIEEKTLVCKGSYEIENESPSGESIGELITDEIIEN